MLPTERLAITFYGDSHALYGHYPATVTAALTEDKVATEVTFSVCAFAGQSPHEVINSLAGLGARPADLPGTVRISVLLLGSSLNSFADLQGLVQRLRDLGEYVVVCTVPPRRQAPEGIDEDWPLRAQQYDDAIRAAYPALVPGVLQWVQVLDTAPPLRDAADPPTPGEWLNPIFDGGDGVHLTDDGYAVLAQTITAGLRVVLGVRVKDKQEGDG